MLSLLTAPAAVAQGSPPPDSTATLNSCVRAPFGDVEIRFQFDAPVFGGLNEDPYTLVRFTRVDDGTVVDLEDGDSPLPSNRCSIDVVTKGEDPTPTFFDGLVELDADAPYRIEFLTTFAADTLLLTEYIYYQCRDTEDDAFYCPKGNTPNPDLYFVVERIGADVTIGSFPSRFKSMWLGDANGLALDTIEDFFPDSLWMLPYDLDIVCSSDPAPVACSAGGNPYDLGLFLTKQHGYPFAFTEAKPIVDLFVGEGTSYEAVFDGTLTADLVGFEFQRNQTFRPAAAIGAEGVFFTALDPALSQRWSGIRDREGLTFSDVTVSHAKTAVRMTGSGGVYTRTTFEHSGVGADVQADGVTFAGSAFRDNQYGLLSDFTPGGQRSSFTLRDDNGARNTIEDNFDVGLVVRNANANVRFTDVVDNDQRGVVVWNGLAFPFIRNRVEGTSDYPGGGTVPIGGDGIEILEGGDLQMTDLSDGPGFVCVQANGFDEAYVAPSGYLFVGDDFRGGQNTIQDPNAPTGTFLIVREVEDVDTATPGGTPQVGTVPAQRTYWGPSGPDPSDFDGPVDFSDFLTTDPACGVGPLARGSGGYSTAATGDGQEALRARIEAARQALRASVLGDASEAEALIGALYGLQRQDPSDALGEHAATMRLIAAIRAQLGTESALTGDQQAATEAALVVEAVDALRRDQAEAAAALLDAHQAAVVGAETGQTVALLQAMTDEAAGRDGEAVDRIEAVIAGLGPEEARRAARLAFVAALIAGPEEEGAAAPDASGTLPAASRTVQVEALALEAPYPNPVAGRPVTLGLALPAAAEVAVSVHDVLGRRVLALQAGPVEAGRHGLRFSTAALAAGTYLVRAEVRTGGDATVLTQRLTVVR